LVTTPSPYQASQRIAPIIGGSDPRDDSVEGAASLDSIPMKESSPPAAARTSCKVERESIDGIEERVVLKEHDGKLYVVYSITKEATGMSIVDVSKMK
jgi:hypothetical protein